MAREQHKTIEAFFEAAGIYRTIFEQLDELIRSKAPSLKPVLVNGFLGYGMTPYTYASGKKGEWPLICLAVQKNYASVYICAIKDGQYYAELFKDELGSVNCGKSCIRFKKPTDLNIQTVGNIAEELESRVKNGETVYGA